MATQYLSVPIADKLRVAASRGYVEEVRELLNQGATCDPDKEGRTPLHYAALNGYCQVVKMLIGDNCDIDAQDVLGFTALHRAASQGHCDVVRTLIDQGCSVDRQGQVHGNTALHEAAWNGYSQCIQTLIKHGKANVFVANKAGFTALHLACQVGHNQSARELLYGGCNPDFKNNYGDTPLHTGSRYGHAGVVRILMSTQCRVNEQNKNGDTALHIAAALRRKKICKLLCESGIDFNIRNKQNETAIDVARRKEHPEIGLLITSQPKTKQHHHGHHRKPRREFDELGRKTPDLDRMSPAPERKSSMDRRTPDPGGTGDGGEKKEKKVLFFFKKKEKKVKGPPPKTEAQLRYEEEQRKRQARLEEKHRQKVRQGFFSHYVPKQGTQYFRDLAGNIRQGPVGYTPLCQCTPALRSLEHKVDTDNENLYAHIDATRDILGQKIDQLGARTSHQIHDLDRTMQERLDQEELRCRQRIDDMADNDRMHYNQNNVQHQLNSWMDARMMHFQRKLQDEYRGYTGRTREDPGYQPQVVRGRRDENVGFPLVRAKSDETLTCSEHSGKKNFTFSRKVAIEHIKRLKEREKHIQQRQMAEKQRHGMPIDLLDGEHQQIPNHKIESTTRVADNHGNNAFYNGHHVPNTTHNESSLYEPVYGRLPASQSTPLNLSHNAQRSRNVHDFDPQRARNLVVYEKPRTTSHEKSEKSSSSNQRGDLYAKPWYVASQHSGSDKQHEQTQSADRSRETSGAMRVLEKTRPATSRSSDATTGVTLYNQPQRTNVGGIRNKTYQMQPSSNTMLPSQSMYHNKPASDINKETQYSHYSQPLLHRPSRMDAAPLHHPSRIDSVPKPIEPQETTQSHQYKPQLRSYKRSNSPDFKRPTGYNERAIDVDGQATFGFQQRHQSLSPASGLDGTATPDRSQNNKLPERPESPQGPDYAQKLRELSRLTSAVNVPSSSVIRSRSQTPDKHYNEPTTSSSTVPQDVIYKDMSQPHNIITRSTPVMPDNVQKSVSQSSFRGSMQHSLIPQQQQVNKQKQPPFQYHSVGQSNVSPGKPPIYSRQLKPTTQTSRQNQESRPTTRTNNMARPQNYQNLSALNTNAEQSSQPRKLPNSKSETNIGVSSHKPSFGNQVLTRSNEAMHGDLDMSTIHGTDSVRQVSSVRGTDSVRDLSGVQDASSVRNTSQSLNISDKEAAYDYHLISDPMKDQSPGDQNMHDSGCGSASPTYTGLPKEGSAGSNPDSGYGSRIYGLHGGDTTRVNSGTIIPNGIAHGSQHYGAPWQKFNQSAPYGVAKHCYDHLIPSNQLPQYPKHVISPLARNVHHSTSGTNPPPPIQGQQPSERDHTVKQALTSELQRWYERMHQAPPSGTVNVNKTPNHVPVSEAEKKHLLPPLSSDV
uniref:Div n=1 Tax=Terebratalia transversa TaxID=34513 RepID=A0A0F6N0S8_TERTR|nr:div [Terebratalia transversa]